MSREHTLEPSTYRPTRSARRRRALLGVVGLTFALAVVMPGAASAANSFTLDTNPASGASAQLAVDSAGTGYFAWEHNGGSSPNIAMYCKVPRGSTCTNAITLPPVTFGGTAVDAPFPVVGSGSTVYVVGPRFIDHNVAVWTSTDGGATFGPAAQVAQTGAYMGNSDPTDVLTSPLGGFYIDAHNPGLSFIGVPSSGSGPTTSADLTPSLGSNVLGDSTLGLSTASGTGSPVEAWSMFVPGQPSTINFRSQSGTGDPNGATTWSASSQITTGDRPSLAGGPSGLFLASQDIDAAGHYTQVDVRKYTPGVGFGAPVATLQSDTSGDNAGRTFQTPGGRLLVAWPGPTRADGVTPIRLYDSTSGGSSFPRVGDVADGTPFAAIYQASIRLAAADDGGGYVSFNESGGGSTFLRVADLTPVQYATTTTTSLTTAGQAAAAKLTVGPGTPITDTATVQGPGGATAIAAGAGVRFAVYSDAGCTQQGRIFASVVLTGDTATSPPITLPIGTWYLQAHYGGNAANAASTSACGAEVVTVNPASAGIAGIIFVGGQILIDTGFNTPGTVLVTTQITNALQVLIPPGPPTHAALASAARKANRCKTGQVLLTVGKKRTCVSNSFGTTTKTIPAPGAYKIKLAPNASARRALARGKTLHVKVTLTFKPTSGGKPVVTNTKITIKGNKAGKK